MVVLSPGVVAASDFSNGKGPFPARDYNPVRLMFLAMPGEEADVLGPGRSQIRMELAESNVIIFENQTNPTAQAVMKFETFRFAFTYRRGITRGIEGGFEIPVLYRDKGILDPFIISVEDAVRRLSPKRVKFTRGSFGGFSVVRAGDTIVSGDRGDLGLGDIALHAKFEVLNEGNAGVGLALRGAVKLPTGKDDLAFGSGKVDLGLGMALQKRIHTKWKIYFNQSVVFPLGTFLDTGFTLNPISTTILAVEWIWSPRFSWVTQIDFFTSPFHGTGVDALDNTVNEATFGFDYALKPHVLWQVYGTENFNVPDIGAAADFTLGTTISYRF